MFYRIHGVRALIYNNDKLLILRRSESDENDPKLWDIPGGGIELNEDIYGALKREIFEETGIDSSDIYIENLHGIIFTEFNSVDKLIIAIFVCHSSISDIKLNSEHSEYAWISTKNVLLYESGRVLKAIRDSL